MSSVPYGAREIWFLNSSNVKKKKKKKRSFNELWDVKESKPTYHPKAYRLLMLWSPSNVL